jgi:hypothetical protein
MIVGDKVRMQDTAGQNNRGISYLPYLQKYQDRGGWEDGEDGEDGEVSWDFRLIT